MVKIETTVKKVKKEKATKKTKKKAILSPVLVKPKEVKKEVKYFEGTGRRKTSIARVRLFIPGDKYFLVNEKPLEKYFPTLELQEIIFSPLKLTDCLEQFNVSVRVKGGGLHSQSEAVRHGIAKALVIFNPELRKKLKKTGFLTRDSRMRERKKFGLKRARRAPQWQKR